MKQTQTTAIVLCGLMGLTLAGCSQELNDKDSSDAGGQVTLTAHYGGNGTTWLTDNTAKFDLSSITMKAGNSYNFVISIALNSITFAPVVQGRYPGLRIKEYSKRFFKAACAVCVFCFTRLFLKNWIIFTLTIITLWNHNWH